MTFDQYWHEDVWLSKVFLEADRLRKEQMNTKLWLQGLYFYNAISCSLQNVFRKKSDPPEKYPAEPYNIFPKQETRQERENREEAERLQAKLYMQQMMRVGKNWGG